MRTKTRTERVSERDDNTVLCCARTCIMKATYSVAVLACMPTSTNPTYYRLFYFVRAAASSTLSFFSLLLLRLPFRSVLYSAVRTFVLSFCLFVYTYIYACMYTHGATEICTYVHI